MGDLSPVQLDSRFFMLHRELRGMVYGYLADTVVRLDRTPDECKLLLHGHVRLNACLISRQFFQEYQEQLPRHMTLVVQLWQGVPANGTHPIRAEDRGTVVEGPLHRGQVP